MASPSAMSGWLAIGLNWRGRNTARQLSIMLVRLLVMAKLRSWVWGGISSARERASFWQRR